MNINSYELHMNEMIKEEEVTISLLYLLSSIPGYPGISAEYSKDIHAHPGIYIQKHTTHLNTLYHSDKYHYGYSLLFRYII